ncbi:ROK family protein [Sphingomonas aerolata]|uniref:ROK family protein n=1 Tax=Sphingomonas aerolata TaxID=185951 RepID=UPI002FE30FAB
MVVDFVQEWYAETTDALKLDRERFIGIGLAIPDDIGTIALPKMPEAYGVWATTNVSHLLQDGLGLPVLRDNDAAAAAIGEAQFGNGRQFTDFFYVLISAGLGGAVVVDNEYVRGGNGRAGELGLLPAGLQPSRRADRPGLRVLVRTQT